MTYKDKARCADREFHIENTTKTIQQVPQFAMIMATGPGTVEENLTASIKQQEYRGTQQASVSEVLPTDGLVDYKPEGEYGCLGFKIGEAVPDDDMFTYVELPPGWTKKPTNHSLWVDIVDEKGRKRTSFFYKAAFYDRSARMSDPVCRYIAQPGEFDPEDAFRELVILDRTKATWERDGTVCEAAILHKIRLTRASGEKAFQVADRVRKQANKWLDEHYPQHADFTAYWD